MAQPKSFNAGKGIGLTYNGDPDKILDQERLVISINERQAGDLHTLLGITRDTQTVASKLLEEMKASGVKGITINKGDTVSTLTIKSPHPEIPLADTMRTTILALTQLEIITDPAAAETALGVVNKKTVHAAAQEAARKVTLHKTDGGFTATLEDPTPGVFRSGETSGAKPVHSK